MPKPEARSAKPAPPPPSASELVSLYTSVGRNLRDLDRTRGDAATYDLWPRFRWIRINEYLASPDKRRVAADLLGHLATDITTRGRGSAAN